MNFQSAFEKNLKATAKFVLLVLPAIIIFIFFQSGKVEDASRLIELAHLLAILPLVIAAVAAYTALKLSSLNKYFCALLFSFSSTALASIYFFISNIFDGSEMDFAYLKIMNVLSIGLFFVLYFQFPLSNKDV
ncbi:hypothetical protein [Rheinheimera sp. UJ63]|uniref:hypothetical protein n=1 Tax=Rheinheimera sp. UJ63 TaxID=2910157 RepID=UPI001F26DD7C|nr:hypothetical protein [Rheinheimera sp. UJ63]MCF4009494.1 hypothetical protein [Rheinheimera sp. UJ63]